jgi:hypothetical protein
MTRFRTITAISAALLTGLALSQCGGKPKVPAQDFSYSVAVSFTPAAIERMKTLGQKATVEAYYYGAPTQAEQSKVNEDGQIDLGMDFRDIDATGQTVKLSGDGIDQARLTSLSDGKPSVTVRVYSSATAGTPNQLACTAFNGTVDTAKAAPVAITCDISRR